MNHLRIGRLLALVAGSLDFASGLGLAILPATTLPLMLVPVPGNEVLPFVRFVGAFVAAVGASYLLALFRWDSARLRNVFEFTLLFRFASGLFAVIAILRGWLAINWMVVPVADFALIGVQLWLIPKLSNTSKS